MEAPILIPPDDAPVFNPNLGGVIESPAAFALLTGRYEDLKTSSFTKIHIPITTLPAVLGRTHPSSDSNVSFVIVSTNNYLSIGSIHSVVFRLMTWEIVSNSLENMPSFIIATVTVIRLNQFHTLR